MEKKVILFMKPMILFGQKQIMGSIIGFNDSNHPNTEKLLFGFIFLNLDIFPVFRG